MFICPQCGASVEHGHDGSDDCEHEGEHRKANAIDDAMQHPVDLPVGGPSNEPKGHPHDPGESSPSNEGCESSGKQSERRPRMKPSALHLHKQRLIVRRAMLCQVPGINRVRAEVIVAKYPTIGALMEASVTELERLPIKKTPLGQELAVALKRVFE